MLLFICVFFSFNNVLDFSPARQPDLKNSLSGMCGEVQASGFRSHA